MVARISSQCAGSRVTQRQLDARLADRKSAPLALVLDLDDVHALLREQ